MTTCGALCVCVCEGLPVLANTYAHMRAYTCVLCLSVCFCTPFMHVCTCNHTYLHLKGAECLYSLRVLTRASRRNTVSKPPVTSLVVESHKGSVRPHAGRSKRLWLLMSVWRNSKKNTLFQLKLKKKSTGLNFFFWIICDPLKGNVTPCVCVSVLGE